ncbi:helix-turn-helix domain-containing protein, partial [Escherichia coli]|nr:helix-turn-helix domain-containing protein [Escherichia coli]
MESLAIRMGVSVRTVQRAINDLEKANLLDKKPTSKSDRRYVGRNIYDLTKLVDYLDTMGPSVAEQVKKPRHKKP